jgi:pimeloyl-ACP methyl ester carboxylesterase
MAVDHRQQAAPRARAAPLARGTRAPRSVFTTIHGLRLHHLEWGSSTAPPLVLVHGLRAHARVWTRVAPYLSPPYRLLAPDLRGHGESAWSDEGYGTLRYADDLAAWLDALGLARIDLVGHSAGGRVAVTSAVAQPERVARLVVVDVGPDVGPAQPFDPVLAAQPAREFPTVDAAAALLRDRYPHISERYLRRMARWSVRRYPDGALRWKWDKRVRGQPLPAALFRADLAALRCPTLIVHGGRRAYLRPEAAAEMQTLAPDSRVVAVPTAGHCVMEERPGTFASIVQRFFAETASPRA